jgi:hypothetical protein
MTGDLKAMRRGQLRSCHEPRNASAAGDVDLQAVHGSGINLSRGIGQRPAVLPRRDVRLELRPELGETSQVVPGQKRRRSCASLSCLSRAERRGPALLCGGTPCRHDAAAQLAAIRAACGTGSDDVGALPSGQRSRRNRRGLLRGAGPRTRSSLLSATCRDIPCTQRP